VQRLDGLRHVLTDARSVGHFQAPIWPGLLAASRVGSPRLQATLGDALADLGLRHRATIEHILSAWETIFLHVRPAAIVADFSPLCLLAARGRIPSVAVGNGYTLPPADMPNFPILGPDLQERKYEEAALVETVNQALKATGRGEIEKLPAIFAADRIALGCFRETDPYAQQRATRYIAPFLDSWGRASHPGDEIFVYFHAAYPTIVQALENIGRAGKALRMYVPGLDRATASRLASVGIAVEEEPLPLDFISRHSRLIVSHGGYGTASFALAAGIPQIVIPFDTEKLLTGQAVERLGAGRCLRLQSGNPLEGPLLAQAILEAADDEGMAARAKSLAPEFLRRLAKNPAEQTADEVEGLLGRQPCSTGGVP